MTQLTPERMLSTAIMLAAERHSNQFDKGGNPYILHPLKVMHYLKTDDLELMSIAVLHDIIEDTNTTYAELAELGFSERVIEGVKALTKQRGETVDQYKSKVRANFDASRVKLADLRHNTDIRRLKGVTQKDQERMLKYHTFYLELQEHVATQMREAVMSITERK